MGPYEIYIVFSPEPPGISVIGNEVKVCIHQKKDGGKFHKGKRRNLGHLVSVREAQGPGTELGVAIRLWVAAEDFPAFNALAKTAVNSLFAKLQ